MTKIFKMDVYRLTHSKVFYASIICLTVMAFALVFSGMSTTLDALMGVAAGAADDFMTTMMGTGIIFILTSIILSLFVCGDYSGGFAKNVFTAHSKSTDYIGGKMLSMAVINGFFIVLYTVLSIIALGIFGYGVTFSGSFIIGILSFMIEKLIVSCAISGVILLIVVFTRNTAWGIFSGFLLATGGLAMGILMFASAFNIGWLESVFSVTISGISKLCTLTFDPIVFIRVAAISTVWFAASCFLSHRTLVAKDVD